MGWKITRDYLFEKNTRRYEGLDKVPSYIQSEKGKQSSDYQGINDCRIKVYDDDGTLYYEAACDSERSAENFFDWSMSDSGTTSSKIKNKNSEWQSFIS